MPYIVYIISTIYYSYMDNTTLKDINTNIFVDTDTYLLIINDDEKLYIYYTQSNDTLYNINQTIINSDFMTSIIIDDSISKFFNVSSKLNIVYYNDIVGTTLDFIMYYDNNSSPVQEIGLSPSELSATYIPFISPLKYEQSELETICSIGQVTLLDAVNVYILLNDGLNYKSYSNFPPKQSIIIYYGNIPILFYIDNADDLRFVNLQTDIDNSDAGTKIDDASELIISGLYINGLLIIFYIQKLNNIMKYAILNNNFIVNWHAKQSNWLLIKTPTLNIYLLYYKDIIYI